MSEDRDQTAIGKDVLGLVLGALALFLGVSVVMSMIEGFPSEPGAVESIVQRYVGLLGAWPGLALCAGIVVVGVLLFVGGPREGSLRTLLGILATSLGLAVLAGAAADAGGAVGGIGALVTRNLGLVAGLVVGAAAVALPAWLAWGSVLPTARPATKSAPPGNPAPPAAIPVEEDPELFEPVLSAIPAPDSDPAADLSRRAYEPVDLPPLYPEDVRHKGEIPPGAQPIPSPHVPPSLAHSHQARADVHAPAEGTASREPAGADLAGPRGPEPASAAGAAEGVAPLNDPASAAPAARGAHSTWHRPSWERSADETEPEAAGGPGIQSAAPPSEAREGEDGEAETRVRAREAGDEAGDDGEAAAELEEEAALEEEEYDEEEEYEEEAGDDEEEEYEEEAEYEGEEEAEYDGEEEAEYEEDLEEEDEEEEEEEPEEGELEEAVVEAQAPPEPQVTLQPAGSSAKAPAGAEGGEAPLYVRAGNLILERQRVAVSLLQREFDLDFAQATEVLDRLQEEGLIGPYIGGKSRDILMDAEQWAARAGG